MAEFEELTLKDIKGKFDLCEKFINFIRPLFPKGAHPLSGRWVEKTQCIKAIDNLFSKKAMEHTELSPLRESYTLVEIFKAIEWARSRTNCQEKWDVTTLHYLILRVKDYKTKEDIYNSPLASIMERYKELTEDEELKTIEDNEKVIRMNGTYGTI